MPPTEDAFTFHLMRALFQLAVYKQAVNSDSMHLPCVTDFGRCVRDNHLVPILMSKPPKPQSRKAVFCKCSKQVCSSRCSCKKAGVPCTAACSCLGQQMQCSHIEYPEESDQEAVDDDFDDEV